MWDPRLNIYRQKRRKEDGNTKIVLLCLKLVKIERELIGFVTSVGIVDGNKLSLEVFRKLKEAYGQVELSVPCGGENHQTKCLNYLQSYSWMS